MKHRGEYVFAALRAGASGFLLKDALPEELVAAVRTVAAGEAILAPSVTRRLLDTYARRLPPTGSSHGVSRSVGLDALTSREREVLVHVAHGLTNAEVAAQLWLSPATVKTHVASILAKLGARDRIQAVIVAYESGLVPTRPADPAS